MLGYLMESVVLAFVIGGVFGAITALHLRQPEQQAVKVQARDRRRKH